MKILFNKYQGTGNDFIMLDNRDHRYDTITLKQVRHLCHRRFGVGADGLILLNHHPECDFEMTYYNSDGSQSLCGNGARCLVKFAWDTGLVKTAYRFKAIDGLHEATVDMSGLVSLKMNDVSHIKYSGGHFILNTGSPHYVMLTNDVMHLNVFKKGREIRYSPEFVKEGINVNFVEQLEESDKIIVRTYERGVEDETYSCGTGVTAAALVCFHNDYGFNRVEVQTLGGYLSVEYDRVDNRFENIWLNGPAEKVFEGVTEVS